MHRKLSFLGYDHMPEKTVQISGPIHKLAFELDKLLPDGPEKDLGMQKLLEAKDCFMRARLSVELKPPDANGKTLEADSK